MLTGAEIGVERQRAVLRQHADGVDLGIDTVTERKIDDAEFSSERDGGFCHARGQYAEAASLSAGKQHADNSFLHESIPFVSVVVSLFGINRKNTAP